MFQKSTAMNRHIYCPNVIFFWVIISINFSVKQSKKTFPLYTTSEKERDVIIEGLASYQYEGIKFYAYDTQVEGSLPVYRFYEPSLWVHFYTPEEKEKTYVMENLDNYNFEGIAYYAMPLTSDI
jgi:Repeat of unknown function (DUF5648)